MKSNDEDNNQVPNDVALFGGQFKCKRRNFWMIGCKVKISFDKMVTKTAEIK